MGKNGLDGPVCLVLSFAGLPLSLRLILLTASAYVSRPRKEDRPWRAAQRVCLGATGPILAEGHAKNRQTSPASCFSLPLPFWLGAYCHLQGPPKSVDFGRKTGPGGPLNEFALGPQAPFWRKGTPKIGKRRPPRALACPSPFGLAPTVIYRAHPSLWTSEGRPALAGRSSSLPWGPQAPILAKGHAKNRQTSPASCFSLRAYRFRCGKFYLHPPLTSVALGGKNSLVGKSMRRKSSQGLSLDATHSFSGTQKS